MDLRGEVLWLNGDFLIKNKPKNVIKPLIGNNSYPILYPPKYSGGIFPINTTIITDIKHTTMLNLSLISYLVKIPNEKNACSANQLKTIALKQKYRAETVQNFREGLKKITTSEPKIICFMGSLYLIGSILKEN